MKKIFISSLIIFSMISVFSVTTGGEIKKQSTIIDELLSLPQNMCYEETLDSFQRRLKTATFGKMRNNDILYLKISGDASYGERLFILHKDKTLYMIIKYSKKGKNEFQFYKRSKKGQQYIGCIPVTGEISISMPPKTPA